MSGEHSRATVVAFPSSATSVGEPQPACDAEAPVTADELLIQISHAVTTIATCQHALARQISLVSAMVNQLGQMRASGETGPVSSPTGS